MPHLPPITTVSAHLEDPLVSGGNSIHNTTLSATSSIPQQTLVSQQTRIPSSIAMSFAFDTIAKTLSVVLKDERSGEVVRTIEYTHIPLDLHRHDKLNGLFLDQFV